MSFLRLKYKTVTSVLLTLLFFSLTCPQNEVSWHVVSCPMVKPMWAAFGQQPARKPGPQSNSLRESESCQQPPRELASVVPPRVQP